jgi:hypothetical protein
MKVHIFGAVSSPSCANYALKKCADDNEHRYDNEVTDTIRNYFYVDDLVKSMEREDEAVKLERNVKKLLAEEALISPSGLAITEWS